MLEPVLQGMATVGKPRETGRSGSKQRNSRSSNVHYCDRTAEFDLEIDISVLAGVTRRRRLSGRCPPARLPFR